MNATSAFLENLTVGGTAVTDINGPRGMLGYGYVFHTGAQEVPVDGTVTFNNLSAPSLGITPNADGFLIVTTGVYFIQWHIRGLPLNNGVPSDEGLWFEITADNVSLGAGASYLSDLQVAALTVDDELVTDGTTLVFLTAGQQIRLHNLTNASTDTVRLETLPDGATNATMLILRLA